MSTKRSPTTKDPLRRQSVQTPKRQAGITGPQPDGTYVRKDGTTVRKKTLWLEDSMARRWSAFCAQHSFEESAFAQEALLSAMARMERSEKEESRS